MQHTVSRANLKENSDFEAKMRGANTVSGEKLLFYMLLKITAQLVGCVCTPAPHLLRTGLTCVFLQKLLAKIITEITVGT